MSDDPKNENVLVGLKRYLEYVNKDEVTEETVIAMPYGLVFAAVRQIEVLVKSTEMPEEGASISIFHSVKTNEVGVMFNYHVKSYRMPVNPDGRRFAQAIKEACDSADVKRIILSGLTSPKGH